MPNLAGLLTASRRRHVERAAFELDDAVVGYAALDDAARVAGRLGGMGVEPGDRVGIMLPNVPRFALAHHGGRACGPSRRRRPSGRVRLTDSPPKNATGKTLRRELPTPARTGA